MRPTELDTTRTWLTRWLIVCSILVAIGMSPRPVAAQNEREYKVKVAYLYKMGLYVNGPGIAGLSADETLVIGILGRDPFGPLLDTIAATRTIHDKKLVIKRFKDWSQYEDSHILFVSKAADPVSVAKAISQTAGQSVLLVGERSGFAEQGGVFNMFLDAEGKVGLQLNIDAAKRRQLTVDARLLKVCDIIESTE